MLDHIIAFCLKQEQIEQLQERLCLQYSLFISSINPFLPGSKWSQQHCSPGECTPEKLQNRSVLAMVTHSESLLIVQHAAAAQATHPHTSLTLVTPLPSADNSCFQGWTELADFTSQRV